MLDRYYCENPLSSWHFSTERTFFACALTCNISGSCKQFLQEKEKLLCTFDQHKDYYKGYLEFTRSWEKTKITKKRLYFFENPVDKKRFSGLICSTSLAREYSKKYTLLSTWRIKESWVLIADLIVTQPMSYTNITTKPQPISDNEIVWLENYSKPAPLSTYKSLLQKPIKLLNLFLVEPL